MKYLNLYTYLQVITPPIFYKLFFPKLIMALFDPTAQLGISVWWLLVITIWETVWTALAMWRAARKKHLIWFIVFLIVSLLAVPEIIYLLVTNTKKRKK